MGTIITVTLNTSLDKTLEACGFQPGRVHHTKLVRLTPAGKGVNISRVLAQLGVASKAAGIVGAGDKALFSDALASGPMPVGDELVGSPYPTRCNTTILDPEGASETHIVEPGFEAPASVKLALGRKLDRITEPSDTVVFAGSLPPGFSPAELADLIGRARAARARVWVDAKFDALKAAVGAEPDLIKPNGDELAWLTGLSVNDPREALRAAATLLDRVAEVLVSLGTQGAGLVSDKERLWARHGLGARLVRNTVGCGDAFLAGFLAGRARGCTTEDALRLAVACGSSSALEPCAGVVDAADVEAFAAEVTIEAFRNDA